MYEISERIEDVLLTYVIEGDPTGIEILGKDVKKPAFDWFPVEFETALRAGAFLRNGGAKGCTVMSGPMRKLMNSTEIYDAFGR